MSKPIAAVPTKEDITFATIVLRASASVSHETGQWSSRGRLLRVADYLDTLAKERERR